MIEKLARRIWSHKAFHSEAAHLRSSLLRARYIKKEYAQFDEQRLLRLLQSSVVLAASPHHEHRQVAYQIATAASELESHHLDGVPLVLLLVLNRIGNFPALAYAKGRFKIDETALPVREVVDTTERRESNSISFDDSTITLTDFQHRLWKELNEGEAVGISAPTSAGKSFILQTYARKLLRDGRASKIAFLVPTRALINQVSDEVSGWLRGGGGEIELITTPVPKGSELPLRAAYVVTQERLQLLQTAHPTLAFDLMLVDEAQSIADGARGVLLSSVIEEALSRNGHMQLLFAGPNISDPGKMATLFGRKPRSVRTDESTVSQNIIFVDCSSERANSAKLSLWSEGTRTPLGVIQCDQPLTDHKSKLVNLALRLGSGGQNLIYALGPKECEDIAFGLSDNENDEKPTEYLNELSGFIKEAVHPKFQLASSVLQGVGFHYGRLPSLVRKAVEDAFADGHLQYLATTSTLLYGVNLPAQNLFLHNPQKGKNQPINAIDFWNLAGRAGRMGKEFSGNIFLVDYGEWGNDPISGTKDQTVKPSIEEHIVDKIEDLLAYINDPERVPDRDKPDELENTFVKLVRDHFEGKLARTLETVGLQPHDERHKRLLRAVAGAVDRTDIAPATLTASPTVSIHRQQSLYERLKRSLKAKGPSYIIPRYPLNAGAYQSYLAAIKRCHDEVLRYPSGDESHKYYAQLALRWIKGEPLPQIIDTSLSFQRKRGKNRNIATVIRETLTEIETGLRFKYVRLFSCYNAVLEQVLRDTKHDDLLASIPAIPMYLEVGACSTTMISFMGVGLSRYTAGKLHRLARKTDMTQADVRRWLRSKDLESLDLPSASVKEIRRMVIEG